MSDRWSVPEPGYRQRQNSIRLPDELKHVHAG